jgi:hypothetical protein
LTGKRANFTFILEELIKGFQKVVCATNKNIRISTEKKFRGSPLPPPKKPILGGQKVKWAVVGTQNIGYDFLKVGGDYNFDFDAVKSKFGVLSAFHLAIKLASS